MSSNEDSPQDFDKYRYLEVSIAGDFNVGNRLKNFPDRELRHQMEEIKKQFDSNFNSITKLIGKIQFSLVLDQMSRLTPNNYLDLFIVDQILLVKISTTLCFGSIEIIPPVILDEILKGSHDYSMINDLLIGYDKEIIDAMSDFILKTQESELWNDYGTYIHKSIIAYRDGHYEASQTLSVAILDSFLVANISKWKIFNKLNAKYKEPEIETMSTFEQLYNYGAFGPVISVYRDDKPVQDLSRHKTFHELSSLQLNRLNALKSLTVISGLIARFWKVKSGNAEIE